MDINSLKHIKPGSNLPKKIAAILVSILVVFVSFSYLSSVNSDAKEFVEIVVVKPKEGLPAKKLVTEDLIKKGKILKTDFKEGMITYDKVDEALSKYSVYFLRYDTPIYYDQLTEEIPLKHDWLYELPTESEVLTIPYDYDKCGGAILAPGDYVRVRLTYEDYKQQTEADLDLGPYFNAASAGKKNYVTELLFDKILVKDMLNSKGQSISEIYKELSTLGKEEMQEIMASKDFMQNVQAKALVFEATPEQVDRYAKSNFQGDFTFTILSRMGNTNLIEQFHAVDKEVKEWTDSNETN